MTDEATVEEATEAAAAEATKVRTVKTLDNGTLEMEKVGGFTVPSDSPSFVKDGGAENEKQFSFGYSVFPSLQVAQATEGVEDKDILAAFNKVTEARSRSNAYQTAIMPYRPSEVAPEDIKARMIRDYIRLGIPEAVAKTQVNQLLAAQKGEG